MSVVIYIVLIGIAYAIGAIMIQRKLADPLKSIETQLRSKHKGKSGRSYGVDIFSNKISDMDQLGVIEPTKVKYQAVASATEATVSILRIDDMISSKGSRPAGGQGGMPPGAGGYGED